MEMEDDAVRGEVRDQDGQVRAPLNQTFGMAATGLQEEKEEQTEGALANAKERTEEVRMLDEALTQEAMESGVDSNWRKLDTGRLEPAQPIGTLTTTGTRQGLEPLQRGCGKQMLHVPRNLTIPRVTWEKVPESFPIWVFCTEMHRV